MRPWSRANRSGRRSTAPSASQALGPTRFSSPAQTGPSGHRRHGCRHESRRPSNGSHCAKAACSQLTPGLLHNGTRRPLSNGLPHDSDGTSVTRDFAIACGQSLARGCPCWRTDRWRAAVNISDNRAVGSHSALFELQAPGELAQMHLEPTAWLTGGPTGPSGEMDSPPRKALGATHQLRRRNARWQQ